MELGLSEARCVKCGVEGRELQSVSVKATLGEVGAPRGGVPRLYAMQRALQEGSGCAEVRCRGNVAWSGQTVGGFEGGGVGMRDTNACGGFKVTCAICRLRPRRCLMREGTVREARGEDMREGVTRLQARQSDAR